VNNVLRRLLIGISLLMSLCGASVAHATDCSFSDPRTFTLSPCSIAETVKFKAPGVVNLGATFTGKAISQMYVAVSATNNDFLHTADGDIEFFSIVHLQIFPSPALSPGTHKGTVDIKFCVDKFCKTLYGEAQLPYTLTVLTVPVMSGISPASAPVGQAAFTLKVTGGFFKPGYQIHLGTMVLATSFVSASELTAKVDLSHVAAGHDYSVQVVPPPGGFKSNLKTFVLKNHAPVLSQVSPVTAFFGAAPFTVTATGKGFMSSSRIKLDGTALTTQYVSSTKLTATVDLSAKATGSYAITVSTPTPGGGTSAQVDLVITDSAPVITSISPTSKPAGGISNGTLTVNGSGFQKNSQIIFSGALNQTMFTSFVSTSQVMTNLPMLLPAGDITVTVVNPAPGGGTSNGVTLAIDAPAPVLAWISPIGAYVGSTDDVVVTAEGASFSANTVMEWNGTPLTTLRTSYGVNNFIQAILPKADLASATTATVSVFTPGPGGGTSSKSFTVSVHPPQIVSLSPGFVAPGGGDLAVTLYGVDFDPSASVSWNGDTLTPDSVAPTQIQVTVPAADVANPGVASVTVINPDANGGVSVPASFAVDVSGTSVAVLAQAVNDIEWDPAKFAFYGSSHTGDVNYPHAIITVDPVLGAVSSSADVTDEADLLSLAKDDEFLYASFPGKIDRLALPSFNVVASMGANTTSALQASPVYAEVVAASEKFGSAAAVGVVMDPAGKDYTINGDGWDVLAWSPDGTTLYGGDDESGKANFIAGSYDLLSISTPVLIPSYAGLWSGGAMHVDAASGLVYADSSTAVIDPGSGTQIATLPTSGVMVPDSSLDCAYMLAQTQTQIDAAAGDWTLYCYSTADQTLTRSIVIPAVNGTPTKMLRWGNEGLAFITDGGYIYFVSGQVVTGN